MNSTKKIYYGTIMFIASIFIVTSCAKEKPEDPVEPVADTTDPVITYLTTIESLYGTSQKVIIDFKVNDETKLKSVELTVKNTTIDSIYLHRMDMNDAKEFFVKDSIVTNLTTTMANFTVAIEAIDSAGNIASSSKGFHVMD
ncbi:MAG: hypothetical protein IPM74_14465 [Crocinitomicaceae bacterium]|nr:hypothetical protein [Crocinitomicaceae bacterium]MBK8927073.1 hypothetical protein [Crocinitomicaceae bacterium]